MTTATPNTLLDAALDYHARGMSVIPTRGKRPAIDSWSPYKTGRASKAELRGWFTSTDADGVAVVCGRASGNLVCRDFDEPESYERWAVTVSNASDLFPTVQTGEGWHVYFRGDLPSIIHRCGNECFVNLGDGELRYDGVYCVLPPSRHPNGRAYRWEIPLPDGPVPFADAFFLGLVAQGIAPSFETEQTEHSYCAQLPSVCSVSSEFAGIWPAIARAIDSTLPTAHRQRNRKIFELARALKAIPRLATAKANELEWILRQWHSRALPNVRTKPFEESRLDFVVAWKRVRYPRGEGSLARACERATLADLPGKARQYDQEELRRLVAICRELQHDAGNDPFYLSGRKASQVLRVSHPTAARWLQLLVIDDILREVAKGSRATSRATRYRYVAEVP